MAIKSVVQLLTFKHYRTLKFDFCFQQVNNSEFSFMSKLIKFYVQTESKCYIINLETK